MYFYITLHSGSTSALNKKISLRTERSEVLSLLDFLQDPDPEGSAMDKHGLLSGRN